MAVSIPVPLSEQDHAGSQDARGGFLPTHSQLLHPTPLASASHTLKHWGLQKHLEPQLKTTPSVLPGIKHSRICMISSKKRGGIEVALQGDGWASPRTLGSPSCCCPLQTQPWVAAGAAGKCSPGHCARSHRRRTGGSTLQTWVSKSRTQTHPRVSVLGLPLPHFPQ